MTSNPTIQYTPEAAAEALAPIGGYLWHSGGGIMCARVDFTATPDDGHYVLVTDSGTIDSFGGSSWTIGLYTDHADDEGLYLYASTSTDLRTSVERLRVLAAAERERSEGSEYEYGVCVGGALLNGEHDVYPDVIEAAGRARRLKPEVGDEPVQILVWTKGAAS